MAEGRNRHRQHDPRLPRRPVLLTLIAAVAVLVLLDRLGGRYGAIEAALCERSTLVGTATHIRDGGTVEVGRIPIRLAGLAAPRWHEPGGPEAAAALRELVSGHELRCELDGTHGYDRCRGVCFLDDLDIAAALVRSGLARDCPRLSGGRYRLEEQAATEAGAGIGAHYALPGYCRAE